MNLEKILRELHQERRWLQDLIAALELAFHSPAHRLISALSPDGRFSPGVWRQGGRRRTELSRLAWMVRHQRGAAGRRARF